MDLNVLFSLKAVHLPDDWKKELEALDHVRFHYLEDERQPLDIDVSSIHYVISYSLFKQYPLEQFPQLKAIQNTSQGLDGLPVDKARKRGIPVFRLEGVFSEAISEFVLLRALQIYKESRWFEANQREKSWRRNRNLEKISGKSAGIVGYGSIGRECAKRFKAFGAEVTGFRRAPQDDPYLDSCFPVSEMADRLKDMDVIVLSLPLTDETLLLFDSAMFAAMKEGSVFINVARGRIVDEKALHHALSSGKLRGAAIDVSYDEPLSADSPLWDLDNCFISPHNSYVSTDMHRRMFDAVYRNLVGFLEN